MLWLRGWEFCRKRDCHDDQLVFHLQGRLYARQWLQQFKNDAFKMLTMRSLLCQGGSRSNLSRMPDDAVIDQTAELLVSRRLHIHAQPARATSVSGGKSQESTAASRPSPE